MSALTTALLELAPGKQWTIQGDRIVWHGSRSGRPTQATISARVAELEAAQPLEDLRIERNKRLAECDWIAVRSQETGAAIPADWLAYRQALRDLPAAYGSLADAIWPALPAS
jgi:hypothetical protein